MPLPHTFASTAPALPTTNETYALMKDLVHRAGELDIKDHEIVRLPSLAPRHGVIVTQTCDLNESRQTEPWFEVCEIRQLEDPKTTSSDGEAQKRRDAWRRTLGGAHGARFGIATLENGEWTHPELGRGLWYVDLRKADPYEKGVLLLWHEEGIMPRVGVPAAQLQRFAERLMARRGRDAVPDVVDHRLFRPLILQLRERALNGTDMEKDALTLWLDELRYRLRPGPDNTWAVTVFVCLSRDCGHSATRRAAEEAIRPAFDAIAVTDIALSLRFIGPDFAEMTAEDMRRSFVLNWMLPG